MTHIFESQQFKVEVFQGRTPVAFQKNTGKTLLFGPADTAEELAVTITNFSETTYVVYFATNDVTNLQNRPVMTKTDDQCNGMVLSGNKEVKCRTRIVGGDVGWDGKKWAVVGAPCVYLIICEDHWGYPRSEVEWNDQRVKLEIKITSEKPAGEGVKLADGGAPQLHMCTLLSRMELLNGKSYRKQER
jgi:hypothetical protein